MLKIDNISFSYKGKKVLSKVSLLLEKGQMAALTGPSGGGKTTLFQLIAGILKQDSGSISIGGEREERRVSKIGYMFQEELLLPWRTLLDNVLLLPELYSYARSDWIEPAKSILDEVGLYDYINYYPHEVSGGMRKRAALASVLLLNPPILLLDEPFSAVDPFRKKSLYQLIRSLQQKRDLTIFFITHQLDDIAALASDVYILNQGAISKVDKGLELEAILDRLIVTEVSLV